MFARDPLEIDTKGVLSHTVLRVKLTELTGDGIGNIDFPIRRLPPLAARTGARVGILLCFIINNDVSFNQVGILFEAP